MIILGLGSNIGERETNILNAIKQLSATEGITIDKVSAIYQTEPIGIKDQPEFLNAVISIKTGLNSYELLKICLDIETAMGRIRTVKWGPRIIDIDLLMFDELVLNEDQLCLPHPRMFERNFVLVPLIDIAGDLPIYKGLTATELLNRSTDDSKVLFYKQINLDA
ncbi:MAG: 2-amino-4-hydroxy-6-hydroxymethyldihydropteridine diphosphokinase [Veillonellaceae bacterium]|jgi:2-amino-4-hydroxy-6-hydroxymethyldihydropteridine diphosphokinase|nr:2-amino-4-hydroxy-6-hydroxymethyldihydropteridine diphosphokinase [Veillonellaceae bacterium]